MRSERRSASNKTEVGIEMQCRGVATCLRMQLFTVDTVLDDCFQLVSLAYMTIGKNHEAPAVYETRTHMIDLHVKWSCAHIEQVLSHLNC